MEKSVWHVWRFTPVTVRIAIESNWMIYSMKGIKIKDWEENRFTRRFTYSTARLNLQNDRVTVSCDWQVVAALQPNQLPCKYPFGLSIAQLIIYLAPTTLLLLLLFQHFKWQFANEQPLFRSATSVAFLHISPYSSPVPLCYVYIDRVTVRSYTSRDGQLDETSRRDNIAHRRHGHILVQDRLLAG